MVFDLLKVGRGEDTMAHYVVTCDLEALGRVTDALTFLVCHSNTLPEIVGCVDTLRAVSKVVTDGKDELAEG